MPSWGKATICRSTQGATSPRTSSIALSAVRVGSETSTWLRTCCTPLAICHFRVCQARCLTSSWLSSALRWAQRSMPSNSVPERFHSGWPAVWVVSRWMCGSMNGGTARPPAPSRRSPASSAACSIGTRAAIRPSATRSCQRPSRPRRRRLSISMEDLFWFVRAAAQQGIEQQVGDGGAEHRVDRHDPRQPVAGGGAAGDGEDRRPVDRLDVRAGCWR